MDTSAQTITTMGIISDEVYNNNKAIIDYFKDEYDANGNKIEKFIRGTNYKVLDHTDPDNQGFNALLLQEQGTTNYVIAFRGTQEKIDIVEDGIIGLKNYSFQFQQAKAWVDDILNNKEYDGHKIKASELTLTGHSLGGILTQAVGAVYQIPGYAFNPYGVDRLLLMPAVPVIPNLLLDFLADIISVGVYKVLSAFGVESSYSDWAKDNILNISYFDNGKLTGDILSNGVTNLTSKHLGNVLQIWGEDLGGDDHRMPNLKKAILHYNDILDHFNDATYQTLTDVYMFKGYEKTEQIFNDLGIYEANNLTFDFLINKTVAELNDKSLPNLYALLHSNPFSIEGNLPAYNNINPDDYSAAFMTDRAQYMYYILGKDERYADGSGKDSYRAFDSFGASLEGNSGNQVIFGTENLNNSYQLQGESGNDRIYGLGGDDEMVGNAGNDYLEGGSGEDTLIGGYSQERTDAYADRLEGGSDYDTYYAGNGDTIYDSDGKGVVSFEGAVLSGKKDNDNYDDDKDGIINNSNNDGKYQTFIINNDANLNKQDTMINRIYKKVA